MSAGACPSGTGLSPSIEPASGLAGSAASIPSADLLYLVKLADWCAGEGFCQIEGLEDPDEWCFRKWTEVGPPNGDGYTAEALASAMSAGTAETAQQAQGEARQRGAGTADAQTPASRNPNP